MRECGLKFDLNKDIFNNHMVTPRAGVWIEIYGEILELTHNPVTPRAGVWIEICGM